MLNEDSCPPFMEDDEIKAKVEQFRSRFARCTRFPVDIESLVEIDLKIDIQPEKGLKSYGNTDAFISSDFRTMHVDEYEYLDERYINRQGTCDCRFRINSILIGMGEDRITRSA